MNTIANTAFTSTILAIDLGKYKSVACVHDQGSGEVRFTTLTRRGSGKGMQLGRSSLIHVFIELRPLYSAGGPPWLQRRVRPGLRSLHPSV